LRRLLLPLPLLRLRRSLRHPSFNANSMALIYVQGLILIGILAGFVNSALISGREHRWAVASAEKSRTTMDLIEKNTNHMVSVMQKSAFKEGFEAGHDQPN